MAAACSERHRATALRRGLTTAGAALALALAAPAAAQQPKVEGEYGLHVRVTKDSLVAQWLTADSVAGTLDVIVKGAPPQQFSTVPGRAHRVALRRPRGNDLLLRYGAAHRQQQETHIALAAPKRPPVEFRGVDTLFIAGDTHGAFDPLVKTLRAAGLVGEALEWTGGRRHLVFAGDLVDRGPHVTRLLWFVYRLEREAATAGGRVHVLLGNHETMVMLGDLRYVHPQESALATAYGTTYDRLFHTGESILGRWLASKPAAIRIDRALVVHGGVVPEYSHVTLKELDATLARFTSPAVLYLDSTRLRSRADTLRLQARDDFFTHPRSLFWYRAYVQTDSVGAHLDSVLHHFNADFMVVGHTATADIEARYDGKVITAHTPRYGGELLLLVRDKGAYRRYRVGESGAWEGF